MKRFLYTITSGNPNTLTSTIIWSTLESFARLIPAALAFYGIKELFDAYLINRPVNGSIYIWISIAALVWFAIQLFLSAIAYDKQYLAAYNVSAQGRTDLAQHLSRLSLGYLDTRDPGDLATMMLGDYALVETAVSHMIPQAFSACILLVIAFFSLLLIDWRMTLCLYATLPIVLLIIHGTTVFQNRLGKAHIKAKVDSASRLQEYLFGIKEIKSHAMGGDKFERLEEAFDRLRNESIKLEGVLGPLVMSSISLLRAGLPILVFAGSYLLANGSIENTIFLAFIIVASRIYDPFTALMMNSTELRYATISAKRIMEIREQPIVNGAEILSDDLTIRFNDVSFAYNDTTVLHSINLEIKPRTLTALVGPSGSGKSTIIKLLSRFYDVSSGELTIGSIPINSLNPNDLYNHLSMVFQDVFLFKDTVINNIRVGNPDASYEEIVDAAQKANCHDFISKLPDGYDTLIGEGGSTLSGGEKQRISIARAFLKKAQIVLLDEVTAALDLENEVAVQTAISNLVADKTVIVIAHRLKTVIQADQIIVLNHGHIEAKGNHLELYNSCDLYKKLVDLQMETETWSFKR